MLKLLEVHFFKGWTKKEKRDFWLSLAITIALCAGLMYFTYIFQSPLRQHDFGTPKYEHVA